MHQAEIQPIWKELAEMKGGSVASICLRFNRQKASSRLNNRPGSLCGSPVMSNYFLLLIFPAFWEVFSCRHSQNQADNCQIMLRQIHWTDCCLQRQLCAHSGCRRAFAFANVCHSAALSAYLFAYLFVCVWAVCIFEPAVTRWHMSNRSVSSVILHFTKCIFCFWHII